MKTKINYFNVRKRIYFFIFFSISLLPVKASDNEQIIYSDDFDEVIKIELQEEVKKVKNRFTYLIETRNAHLQKIELLTQSNEILTKENQHLKKKIKKRKVKILKKFLRVFCEEDGEFTYIKRQCDYAQRLNKLTISRIGDLSCKYTTLYIQQKILCEKLFELISSMNFNTKEHAELFKNLFKNYTSLIPEGQLTVIQKTFIIKKAFWQLQHRNDPLHEKK